MKNKKIFFKEFDELSLEDKKLLWYKNTPPTLYDLHALKRDKNLLTKKTGDSHDFRGSKHQKG